jgi:hypothetical protein
MNARWQASLPAPAAAPVTVVETTAWQRESRFREYLDVLIDNRWLIGTITALALLAGVAYALFGPRVYEANILIQVEDPDRSGGNFPGDANGGGGISVKTPTAGETEILKSRMVLGQAMENTRLYISARPNYIPVVGEFIARHSSQLSTPHLRHGLLGHGPLRVGHRAHRRGADGRAAGLRGQEVHAGGGRRRQLHADQPRAGRAAQGHRGRAAGRRRARRHPAPAGGLVRRAARRRLRAGALLEAAHPAGPAEGPARGRERQAVGRDGHQPAGREPRPAGRRAQRDLAPVRAPEHRPEDRAGRARAEPSWAPSCPSSRQQLEQSEDATTSTATRTAPSAWTTRRATPCRRTSTCRPSCSTPSRSAWTWWAASPPRTRWCRRWTRRSPRSRRSWARSTAASAACPCCSRTRCACSATSRSTPTCTPRF